MDFAGASPVTHALRRLLGVWALVALLALGLAAASAHAQAQAPPDTAGQTQPDPSADPGWDGVEDLDGSDDWDHDWDDGGSDWPGNGSTQAPSPGADAAPAEDDGWSLPGDEEAQLPRVTTSTVPGKVARMRTDGKAAIPLGAPKRVRSLIGQYNRIVGKRYKWGGGHAKLVDTGYDCSGAVGYGLIGGGLLRTTMVSGRFARWGAAGEGRWVTIYAHRSHVYVEVAGLRLDTSAVGDRSGRSGVRWRPAIGARRGFKVRHPVGL